MGLNFYFSRENIFFCQVIKIQLFYFRIFYAYVFKWSIVAKLRASKVNASSIAHIFQWFFASTFSGGIRGYKIHICRHGHSLLPMKLFLLDTNDCCLGSKAKKNGIGTRSKNTLVQEIFRSKLSVCPSLSSDGYCFGIQTGICL